MDSDSLNEGTARPDGVRPMDIAHNDRFTAKEKIELLNQLKADITVAQQEGREPGIALEEIDRAIAEVRQDIEGGHGPETPLRGDS